MCGIAHIGKFLGELIFAAIQAAIVRGRGEFLLGQKAEVVRTPAFYFSVLIFPQIHSPVRTKQLTTQIIIIAIFLLIILGCGNGGESNTSVRTGGHPQSHYPPVAHPTAQCKDGSVSYSTSRSDTCLHQGGVEKWFRSTG